MLTSLGPYLAMWSLISSEVYKGQSLAILDRAGAHDNDLDVFLSLESELNQWRIEKAKRQRGA